VDICGVGPEEQGRGTADRWASRDSEGGRL